jgi:DNA-binding NarL/FixJ family response regulator
MIQVLIADDHALVRDGLRRIISESPLFHVAVEAADGNEALQRLRSSQIELALFDLSMPGRSGVDLIKQAKLEFPRLRILVLTMHEEEQYAVRAIKAGASGYLTKDTAPSLLLGAMEKVARGGMYISPRVAEQLALSLHNNVGDEAPHRKLSDREYEIFLSLVSGSAVGEIAGKLNLSIKTVSTHKAHILQKMRLQSIADLVRYAVEHELQPARSHAT